MPLISHEPSKGAVTMQAAAVEATQISGVVPILVTPFTADGEVDGEQVDRQIDFLASTGIGWVGLGFGSEVPRLDAEELSALMTRVVQRSAGRLAVVGNAEMTGVRSGVSAVRRVAAAGADAAMLRPSGLAGLPQDTLFAAIAQVARESAFPVVVQDAPQNTFVELSAATLARLLREVPEVVAVKVEPPAPAPKISQVVRELDGAPGVLIGGLGGAEWLHELERGATATMPGPAMPEIFAGIARRHAAGDRAAAIALVSRVLPLVVLGNRGMDTFLTIQKHVLTRRGVLTGTTLREPHAHIEDRLLDEVDELLEALDLLALCADLASETT
jgi:dihydrodipicolinate synthase/N-acetylneuraminate lyase